MPIADIAERVSGFLRRLTLLAATDVYVVLLVIVIGVLLISAH